MQARFFLMAVAACSVAGCNAARNAEITAAAKAGRDQCQAMSFQTAVQLQTCINEANVPIGANSSDKDLFQLLAAARIEIAERQDRKTITAAQAALEYAKLAAEVGSERERRANNAQQSRAAVIGAINSGSSTTCIRNGNITNCF